MLANILSTARNPEFIREVYSSARRFNPEFPNCPGAGLYVLSRLFEQGGAVMGPVPSVGAILGGMVARGALLLPAGEPPRAGDLFICCLPNWVPVHAGMVDKPVLRSEPREFLAIDPYMERTEFRSYRRPVGGSPGTEGYLPVRFWVRWYYG